MPFIRQSRDKRGIEHTYVMHVARSAAGVPRTRVLYLFRSPANLRVGRQALDAEVREALEHTHPDLVFDWPGLLRDMVVSRPDPSHARSPQPKQQRPASPVHTSGAAEAETDESLLGRVLGTREAARLRQRFADLRHRIERRARTPEIRDALLARLAAFDPAGWTDETTIRSEASRFDSRLDELASRLPVRRRGRRGSRGGAVDRGPDPSGIMTSGAETHAESFTPHVDGPDGPAPGGGDDAAVGPAAAAAGLPGDD